MVSINIVGLTEGTLIQRAHVCAHRLTEACKQTDYTDVPRTPAMPSKNDGQSESEDGRHRSASLHLCHSANPSLLSSITSLDLSPDAPPKASSPLRASVATLSLLCMPTFLHESHLFLPPFPAFTPLCLVKSRGREEKKRWKMSLCFSGSLLRQDRLPCDTSVRRRACVLM